MPQIPFQHSPIQSQPVVDPQYVLFVEMHQTLSQQMSSMTEELDHLRVSLWNKDKIITDKEDEINRISYEARISTPSIAVAISDHNSNVKSGEDSQDRIDRYAKNLKADEQILS